MHDAAINFRALAGTGPDTITTIAVRQAALSDLDALVSMFDCYRQFYGRPADPDGARKFLEARMKQVESVLFIAHDGEAPIGFTQLYPSFSSVSLARIFILNDIYVLEHGRRKRAGSLLVEKAVEYARSMRALRLTLATAVDNQTAQALYQSAGWKRDTQFQYYHFAITQ